VRALIAGAGVIGTVSAQSADPRYLALPSGALPRTESLADVSARLLPYWQDAIVPDLRALAKQLESIPDDLIAELDIPTGMRGKHEG
jgi:2,3-bisphosphoglycerate-dependent phosphoglycerate mutase